MTLLGILSDTHNNLPNLQAAVDICRREGVSVLVHCGDLTNPDSARALEGFRVIYTFGNGDYATGEILVTLKAMDPDNFAGMVFIGEIEGIAVAAIHGHLPEKLSELVDSGRYRYIFRGHSHRHSDELRGPTRVINPGALGGLNREQRQFCLLDLETGAARFVKVD